MKAIVSKLSLNPDDILVVSVPRVAYDSAELLLVMESFRALVPEGVKVAVVYEDVKFFAVSRSDFRPAESEPSFVVSDEPSPELPPRRH